LVNQNIDVWGRQIHGARVFASSSASASKMLRYPGLLRPVTSVALACRNGGVCRRLTSLPSCLTAEGCCGLSRRETIGDKFPRILPRLRNGECSPRLDTSSATDHYSAHLIGPGA
jgi:hypothetical protein